LDTGPARTGETGNVSCLALFVGFSRIGLAGFGGVLPWARRLLVERECWLTAEGFNTLLGLCQFLPGPNVVNLAVVVGRNFQGVRGAIAAPLGLLAGPVAIVLVLGWLYDAYGALPLAQAMLQGISAVGGGLLIAMSWRMAVAVKEKRWFLPFALLAFVAIAVCHWPLLLVMPTLLLGSAALAWWRLVVQERLQQAAEKSGGAA
jgi:chromate transporter